MNTTPLRKKHISQNAKFSDELLLKEGSGRIRRHVYGNSL